MKHAPKILVVILWSMGWFFLGMGFHGFLHR